MTTITGSIDTAGRQIEYRAMRDETGKWTITARGLGRSWESTAIALSPWGAIAALIDVALEESRHTTYLGRVSYPGMERNTLEQTNGKTTIPE